MPGPTESPLTEAVCTALVDAVRAAARAEILPRFRNLPPGTIDRKSGPEDLVTEADRAAERAIAAAARALLPEALIVGEEAVHDDPALLDRLADADIAVIIDPVDGTANFAAGLAVFGVILAVTVAGRTAFGLLYDPVMDDWVMARRGTGAWFCQPGRAPRRLSGPPPREAGSCRGYISLHLLPRDRRAEIGARLAAFGPVTSLRCSCHEYRMLAFGEADFMVAPQAKPWDHAAGVLIVEECGAVVESGGQPGYAPGRPAAPVFVRGHPDTSVRLADIWG